MKSALVRWENTPERPTAKPDGQICWSRIGAPARNQIAMTASKDHATPEGSRHERPKRITPQMVRQVPGGMHQPCNSDEPVRPKSRVDNWCCKEGVSQLPDPESAAEVGAAGVVNVRPCDRSLTV